MAVADPSAVATTRKETIPSVRDVLTAVDTLERISASRLSRRTFEARLHANISITLNPSVVLDDIDDWEEMVENKQGLARMSDSSVMSLAGDIIELSDMDNLFVTELDARYEPHRVFRDKILHAVNSILIVTRTTRSAREVLKKIETGEEPMRDGLKHEKGGVGGGGM